MTVTIHDVDGFPDLKVIKLPVYKDHRGFFTETFRPEVEDILGVKFLQDNHSYSHSGVLRGIHYQWDKPMGKLVRVVSGAIIDFAIDLRHDSPTFGKYHFEYLSPKNNHQFWIPAGFGHAFVAIEPNTNVTYKCSAIHNPLAESAINPFDPDLNINWMFDLSSLIMSDKDKLAASFADYKLNPRF